MARVKIYSTDYCGFCFAAKALLARRSIDFEEVNVTESATLRRWLLDVTGARTVPQIFVDETPIGGYRELVDLDRSGELQRRLAAAAPPGAQSER